MATFARLHCEALRRSHLLVVGSCASSRGGSWRGNQRTAKLVYNNYNALRRFQAIRPQQSKHSSSIDRIDLLKIDVQGHEAAVLRGASELLNQGRIDGILMELNWWADDVSHSPAMESVQQLEAAGFWFAKPEPELVWKNLAASVP